MVNIVCLRLPEEIQRELKLESKQADQDRSALMRELLTSGLKARRLERALALYAQTRISLGRAAEKAGISLWEAIAEAQKRGLPSHYSAADLDEDIATAEK